MSIRADRARHTRLLFVALFLVVACVLVAASTEGSASSPEPQRGGGALKTTGPTKGPLTRFLHEHHSGQVPVPGKRGQTRELKCETCHAVSLDAIDTNKFPGPDLVKYPETAKLATTGTRINRIGFAKAHSACTECHGEIGPGSRAMCAMCHVSTAALKPFPNPDVELSQFADDYSHKAHKDYFDANPNPSGKKTDEKPERGLRCSECHDPERGGVKMTLPQHDGCFVCHANEKIVPQKAATFWSKCTGCHTNMAENKPTVDPALKASKDAANAVAAVVMPFRYVVTPSGRGNAPFNHVGGAAKYHEAIKPDTGRNAGKTLEGKAACIFCHTSAERAGNRVQMKAFSVKKTDPQATQPPATACSACHVHAEQMWFAKTPATKADRNKCLECHTAADAAKEPPDTHKPPEAAEKKPAATPEAKPAAKPTATPAEKPAANEEKPESKPEGSAQLMLRPARSNVTARMLFREPWAWGR
jgi:hypothetical protein